MVFQVHTYAYKNVCIWQLTSMFGCVYVHMLSFRCWGYTNTFRGLLAPQATAQEVMQLSDHQ